MISALLIIREGLYEALRHNAQPLNDSLFSIITNLVCLGTSWGGYQRSTPAMDPVRGNKGPQYWRIFTSEVLRHLRELQLLVGPVLQHDGHRVLSSRRLESGEHCNGTEL